MEKFVVLVVGSGCRECAIIKKLIEDINFFTEQNILALRNTRMANSLNLCSLTIPLKLNFSGLMFFCHPNQEEKLMRIGLTVENEISKS